MTNPRLKAAYDAEMRLGYSDLARVDLAAAYNRFERAHILGQRSTRLHVRAHCALLRVGWLRRDLREIVGQLTRMVAAVMFSRVWVPEGNTGGANVSAFRSMPLPEDLRRVLHD